MDVILVSKKPINYNIFEIYICDYIYIYIYIHIYMRLLKYYLKAISILLRILINYKTFLFASEKEFRIGDIKLKSFEILRNVFRSKIG